MENGMIVARQTDNRYTAVHIEEEVLQFARLNRLTRARLAEGAKRRKADRSRQEAAERRRRSRIRETWGMVKAVALMAVIGAALVWGMMAALVSPLWAVPALAACIAAATYQIGLWMGRRNRKEK